MASDHEDTQDFYRKIHEAEEEQQPSDPPEPEPEPEPEDEPTAGRGLGARPETSRQADQVHPESLGALYDTLNGGWLHPRRTGAACVPSGRPNRALSRLPTLPAAVTEEACLRLLDGAFPGFAEGARHEY